MKHSLRKVLLGGTAGFLFCTVVAQLTIELLGAGLYRGVAALIALPAIVVAAAIFGRVGGLAGVFGAAMVFTAFLFDPLRTWNTLDRFAVVTSAWMVVAGVFLAWVIGKPHNEQEKHGVERNQR
jgi:K+-sensing histidine kinase KdpD